MQAAVLAKYGREYFVSLRGQRKNLRSGEIAREERDAYDASMLATRLMSFWRNGQKGGLARRALYGAQQCSEWVLQGGMATRERYGRTTIPKSENYGSVIAKAMSHVRRRNGF